MSRLAFLREGIPEHKITIIPNSVEKVAIAALNNKEILEIREESIKYLENKDLDIESQDLVLKMFTLSKAMRVKDSINECYVNNFEEINEYMDPYQVYKLYGEYLEVQSNSVPELQDLSLSEFEDIKKKLKMMDLKDLDGELQTILKHFLAQMNLKDLLQDN